jgi:hypothetical protein
MYVAEKLIKNKTSSLSRSIQSKEIAQFSIWIAQIKSELTREENKNIKVSWPAFTKPEKLLRSQNERRPGKLQPHYNGNHRFNT